jgi:RNA polymerase sigma factor (sigma-70 family)
MMDRSEFTARVLECERTMYKTAYCMLHNSADCQDAVQETIFKAWSKKDSLRDEDAFESWLMQILVNTCRSILRTHSRHKECELEDIYPAPPSGNEMLLDSMRSPETSMSVTMRLSPKLMVRASAAAPANNELAQK